MLSESKKNEIRAVLREQGLTDIEAAKRAFPEENPFEIRKLVAEYRREVRDDAVDARILGRMTPRGRAAWEAGFFEAPTITLPTPKIIKSTFPKAGKTYGLIMDVHAGSGHDYSALDVAIQVLQAAGIDELGINGDLFDCEAFSRHDRSREQFERFIDERKLALPVVKLIDTSFPGIPKWLNYGNHDLRPLRFIAQNAPALEDLFPLENILGINQTDIVPTDGRRILAGKVLVKHGTKVSQDAGQSAKKELLSSFMSTVSGHVHRLAHTKTRRGAHEIMNTQPHFNIEGGCLCNLRPKYLAAEDTSNWQQGLVILTEAEDGYIAPELVEIHNGTAVFRGRVFSSRLAAGQLYQEL